MDDGSGFIRPDEGQKIIAGARSFISQLFDGLTMWWGRAPVTQMERPSGSMERVLDRIPKDTRIIRPE